MNRIDRISAILIQLQGKQIVKAAEIAERFGISLRTVYRDIRSLQEAGVPIGSEAGTGYFLADGYHLPPVMFTVEEAAALMLAGKMVDKLASPSAFNNYNSALYKIKSVLPGKQKEYISTLDSHIEILYNRPENASANDFLPQIQQALVEKKVINIEYISAKNEHTKRLIEPAGLCFYSLGWHLIAFCRHRNEMRDFRIDRIKKLSTTSEKFTPRQADWLDSFYKSNAQSDELQTVVLRFNPLQTHLINTQKYYYGLINENVTTEFTEMTFLTNSLPYIAQWLLTLGNSTCIVSPETLRPIVCQMVEELHQHYLKKISPC